MRLLLDEDRCGIVANLVSNLLFSGGDGASQLLPAHSVAPLPVVLKPHIRASRRQREDLIAQRNLRLVEMRRGDPQPDSILIQR